MYRIYTLGHTRDKMRISWIPGKARDIARMYRDRAGLARDGAGIEMDEAGAGMDRVGIARYRAGITGDKWHNW